MDNKVRIIAFYLPQFYPFKENDEWWGKGFTEWTNVGKAKPLFKGHNQPRVPTELSYYDLRIPEVREQQVQLAKDAGVTAFCYWHYWFGNGKRLLERVFDEVLESGKPDFPFCLGWANHSWYAKTWDKESKERDRLLIEQTYPGIEDARMHFNYLLKAFKDHRYVKVDGKPFFLVFEPKTLPQIYIEKFKEWATESGFPGLFMVANIFSHENKNIYLAKGYDAVVYRHVLDTDNKLYKKLGRFGRFLARVDRFVVGKIMRRPSGVVDYRKYYKLLITEEDTCDNVIPQIIPQYDHSPRSGRRGMIFIHSTPSEFYKHVKNALQVVRNKPKERRIIMLKSWNEWGEGNYMEPDIKYGRGFIDALKKAIVDVEVD